MKTSRLVLTRRIGERIKIGNDIWITLLATEIGRARLAIEAPHDIAIWREELLNTFNISEEEDDADAD